MTVLPSAAEIARQVSGGRRTAAAIVEQCLETMQRREPQLNAVALPLSGLARELAAEVDRRLAAGESVGPLAGVPFTVKECYHIAGTPHTLGRHRTAPTAERHSPIVERLIRAGAIPVAKSNLSQLMLLYETENPRYGRTNHPLDPDRSPGGSGGGDAAALAADYACFAMGTDMGGSVRQPAHSCGLVGFLPTRHRIETAGVEQILPSLSPLDLQAALMTRRVEDVELVLDVLSEPGPVDGCFAAPWSGSRREVSDMRIGWFDDQSYFPTCPTMRRAVRQSVERLRQAGAETTEMAPPDLCRVVHLFCAVFGADGGQHIRDRLRGERIDWRIRPLLRMGRLPRLVRRAVARAVEWSGQRRLAGILDNSYRCSAATLWRLSDEITRFRDIFFRQMASLDLDAVVMPAHATIAYRHGASHNMLPATGYAMLANLLGAPSGVLPAARVRADEQTMDINPRSWSERRALKNLEGAKGLPCGVQVLGAPWNDAGVLEVMKAVQRRTDELASESPAVESMRSP